MRTLGFFALTGFIAAAGVSGVNAQSFAAASIHPSAAQVQFEHDGKTDVTPGNLRMRDVTVATCIKWAYGVVDSQISGPAWLETDHFDIVAKAGSPADEDQLKLMMRTLLAERFQLVFHRQDKELRSYLMTLAKSGAKFHEAPPGELPSRENSAIGTVARAITMKDFAEFISGPLQMPVVDQTGLAGRYDLVLDFTRYLPPGETVMKTDFENTIGIIVSALRGELGLEFQSKKENVEVLVIDRVEHPSEN